MASRRDVVTFLTAPARSGKSFNEVRKLCDETLPLENGPIYTNLPLHVDRIAEYCKNKHNLDPIEVIKRLHIIPREEEKAWKNAGQPIYDESGMRAGTEPPTGPWEYFTNFPLSGATIIIDEIHNFCGSIGTPKAISNQWQKWLGELGHNQAVFRCLSQSPEKVHPCIKQEAAAAYTIRNTGLERDPYFGIEIYDWLELWCGFTGSPFKIFVFEQETKKVEGQATKGQRKLHLMGMPYFDFYDSFNAPIAHAATANVRAFEHEYEKHIAKGFIKGRLSLAWWFFQKHFHELATRGLFAAIVITFLALCLTGVAPKYFAETLIKGLQSATKSAAKPGVQPTQGATPGTRKNPAAASPNKGGTGSAQGGMSPEAKLIAQQKAELETLKSRLEAATAIVLMTPESITLRDGYTYATGDTIDTGPHKGRKIKSITWSRRHATLDDETILNLGN